jgi:ribose 5-phosphate isomerase B
MQSTREGGRKGVDLQNGVILFVCTGNTCRSPLAAALWSLVMPEMPAASAGVAAWPGSRASEPARDVAREYGVDLDGHRARTVDEVTEPVRAVLTMTAEQKAAVLTARPDWAGRVWVLTEAAGESGDIPDPWGSDRQVYRGLAERILDLERRVADRVRRGDIAGLSGQTLHGKDASKEANMRIAVGADHAGFPLKEPVVDWLVDRGFDVHDVGTFDTQSVDYPDFALKVAQSVANGQAAFGLLFCGTGLGMAIAANKVRGVRAVTCHELTSARLARQHNDANVLTMGGRLIAPPLALEIIEVFLNTPFEGGRHLQRIEKIAQAEHPV